MWALRLSWTGMMEQRKKLNCKRGIIWVALLLALMGCHNEMDDSAQLQLSLCLPIQDSGMPAPKKVMGDPGTTEHFELPRYAYIFVMKQTGVDSWAIWRKEELILNANDWVRTRYYGLNDTREDSIFKYNKPIQYILNNETPTGRVYAVCSKKKLTFNTSFNSITNLEDLLNWKFDSSPDSIQENLQDIYSTPYNYIRDGRYYCAFDCSAGNTFGLDLLMYHVAAKVDLKWNVVDSVRINTSNPSQAVRLTYLAARRLFNGEAYCFKPMRNTLPALPSSGGYEIDSIVTPSDEGLWWEGRSYFYTIPYTVEGAGTASTEYFPLQLLMRTNGSSGSGYELTLNQPIDTADVFVPWIRGDIKLTKPLADQTDTKTIESNGGGN